MYSLRLKLNDVIGKDEQVILENIRRCKQFVGKQFRVIFWNDGLSEKDCKDFVKRNLDLNKYNDLILMNVIEDNMQGTINVGDLALIIKFQNKRIKDVIFKNGIYAINFDGNICIRRLQFLKLKQRTLVHIISDNKKYRDDPVDFLELLPLIYGEVVWRSNNFQDIDFIKHENKEPNLFLPEEDIEIPMLLNNNKKETA